MYAVRSLVACLALTVGVSCAPRYRPLLLEAGPAERESLLGAWSGTYDIEGGRRGDIGFTLAADGEQASGDVLMIADGAHRAYRRTAPGSQGPGVPPVESEILTIRFVRAVDGKVTGVLTPYWDPERACEATATFGGIVDGFTMDGTFRSTCGAGGPTYSGRWTMRRTGPVPRRE
jgi:hypothetical protein